MSRTTLKKEIADFTADQLRELVLEIYTASKDAREYLDFYVNPDADAMMDKHIKMLDKELVRGKYGRSTARVSRIRTILKHLESFGIGADQQIKVMMYAWRKMISVERVKFISQPFYNGIFRLMKDILDYADRYLLFDATLKEVTETMEENIVSRSMRARLKEALSDYFASRVG